MFYTLGVRKFAPVAFFSLIILIAVTAAALIILQTPDASTVGAKMEAAPILILDAGHGGEDGGAVSPSGLLEKDVNLDVALRAEAIAGFLGISTDMTRRSDDIGYPESAVTTKQRKAYDQRSRIELINSYPDAVLLSIHQNKYPASSPRGSQVLYAATEGSGVFAEIAHQNLINALYPENRRVAAPISESIFLMRSVTCPAILVECAFLSNPTEEELLKTDSYKCKIAAVLITSYLQYQTAPDSDINF